MAKNLERKKPGYTKGGEVKIVSLNYKQCTDMISKTTKKKIEAKIRRRMQILSSRPGFKMPVDPVATTTETTQ